MTAKRRDAKPEIQASVNTPNVIKPLQPAVLRSADLVFFVDIIKT